MSDMAIVKFSGDLGPAAKALVEKVSAGLGRVYEPTHTKRIAKAEAKAEMIRAESELAVSDLQRRTIRRIEYAWAFLETRDQPGR